MFDDSRRWPVGVSSLGVGRCIGYFGRFSTVADVDGGRCRSTMPDGSWSADKCFRRFPVGRPMICGPVVWRVALHRCAGSVLRLVSSVPFLTVLGDFSRVLVIY